VLLQHSMHAAAVRVGFEKRDNKRPASECRNRRE